MVPRDLSQGSLPLGGHGRTNIPVSLYALIMICVRPARASPHRSKVKFSLVTPKQAPIVRYRVAQSTTARLMIQPTELRAEVHPSERPFFMRHPPKAGPKNGSWITHSEDTLWRRHIYSGSHFLRTCRKPNPRVTATHT